MSHLHVSLVAQLRDAGMIEAAYTIEQYESENAKLREQLAAADSEAHRREVKGYSEGMSANPKLYADPAPPADVQELQKLLGAIKYIVGIAERGTGRSLRDDESAESFVLGYVAGLERKLAEQQAVALAYRAAGLAVRDRLTSSGFGAVKPITHGERDMVAHLRLLQEPLAGVEELNTLLAKAREEGRKEAVLPVAKAYAWSQSLFKGAHRCTSSGDEGDAETLNDIANWILACAPTPGDKE